MTSKPLCIDLFCGRFGWSAGWLDLGGYVVGFDLVHEDYHGPVPSGASLVLQDVLTLHGRQFRDASLILASPPCPFFSYTSMPWTKARVLAETVRADRARHDKELALFRACFRIQREASEAAGRHVPMVVENVRGAQKWVGRARWMFGSFALWGDVPALMPIAHKAVKLGDGASWYPPSDPRHVPGIDFTRLAAKATEASGVKVGGAWFGSDTGHPMRQGTSKGKARKAASAAIAKIPFALSSHIARVYYPQCVVEGVA